LIYVLADELFDAFEIARFRNRVVVRAIRKFLPDFYLGLADFEQVLHMR